MCQLRCKVKRALALLWERRAECPAAAPVLVVHDEVVVECPAGDADRAGAWLKRAMLFPGRFKKA